MEEQLKTTQWLRPRLQGPERRELHSGLQEAPHARLQQGTAKQAPAAPACLQPSLAFREPEGLGVSSVWAARGRVARVGPVKDASPTGRLEEVPNQSPDRTGFK